MRPPSSDAYQAAFDRFLAADIETPLAVLQAMADEVKSEEVKYVAARRHWRRQMGPPKSRIRPLVRA